MSDEEAAASAPTTAEAADTSRARTLQGLLERVRNKPCSVVSLEKIYLKSGKPLRTKEYLIDRELERLYQASTLDEILEALNESLSNLRSLEVFDRIEAELTNEPENEPSGCGVTLDISERSPFKLRAGTYIQGSDTSLELTADVRNLLGHAEQLQLSAQYGAASKSNEFALAYRHPRLLGYAAVPGVRIAQQHANHQAASSFCEALRSVTVSVGSMDKRHEVAAECGWRHISDPSCRASKAVQAQLGDYMKSALRYTRTWDQRLSSEWPFQGWAARSTSELFALAAGGAASAPRFAKQHLEWQLNVPLHEAVAASFAVGAGLLLPLGGLQDGRPSSIADRYFAGGQASVRGFDVHTVGPVDARRPGPPTRVPADSTSVQAAGPSPARSRYDSLGGDLYATVLGALTFRLPHPAVQALGIHGQLFLNGGTATLLTGTGRPASEGLRDFASSWRWSAGLGVVIPTWLGRFEANYTWVLRQQEHDRCRTGIQLGFAPSMFV